MGTALYATGIRHTNHVAVNDIVGASDGVREGAAARRESSRQDTYASYKSATPKSGCGVVTSYNGSSSPSNLSSKIPEPAPSPEMEQTARYHNFIRVSTVPRHLFCLTLGQRCRER